MDIPVSPRNLVLAANNLCVLQEFAVRIHQEIRKEIVPDSFSGQEDAKKQVKTKRDSAVRGFYCS
jgi:hypothetical protein